MTPAGRESLDIGNDQRRAHRESATAMGEAARMVDGLPADRQGAVRDSREIRYLLRLGGNYFRGRRFTGGIPNQEDCHFSGTRVSRQVDRLCPTSVWREIT